LGAVVVPPNGQTEGMFFARADGNDLASGRNTLRLNCADERGTLTTVRTEFPAP
jgi:hypothetical protein